MPSRRRRYRYRPKPQVKRPPANEEIKVLEVRLVGADGTAFGVVSTEIAKQKAEEAGSDLVIVAEKANPPVARIMDLGKHVYEQQKKEAKQKVKSKSGEVKGIRIGFKIGDHDLNIRLKQADEFLSEGHKVKVEMRLRGREKGRMDMALQKIKDFVTAVPGQAYIEGNISRAPNGVTALIGRTRGSAKPAEDESDEA